MNEHRYEFPQPTTLEEAEDRRLALTADIETIQKQLGSRNALRPDGTRRTAHEFWEWRDKAKGALHFKVAELRMIKEWLKEHRASAKLIQSQLAGLDGADQPTQRYREAHHQFCDYVRSLEQELIHLRAENHALRTQIDVVKGLVPKPGAHVAPADGQESWRFQHDPEEVES